MTGLLERRRRVRDARTWEGFRAARFNHQTGTLIVVLRDPDGWFGGDPTCPWVTVCDDHGLICSHPSRALAYGHAAQPSGWCEGCQKVIR